MGLNCDNHWADSVQMLHNARGQLHRCFVYWATLVLNECRYSSERVHDGCLAGCTVMAPKRKAPSATQSQANIKKTKSSPGKLRSVTELFAALPATSKPSKKTARDLISSSCTAQPQDGHIDPWTETYAPTSRAQLAVHKKKVEVRLGQA